MDYKSADRTAIAISDAKGAALYFDHVLPLSPDYAKHALLTKYLAPKDIRVEEEVSFATILGLLPSTCPISEYCLLVGARYGAELVLRDQDSSLIDRPVLVVETLLELLAFSSIDDFALFGRAAPLAESKPSEPCLTLGNLQIVDSTALSWKQIVEFRADSQRVNQLRRLRRFIFSEYDGKPPDYIREDIEERIEQYEEATKFWGLPTVEGFLRIALTTESAAMLASFSSALFGAPLATAATVGGSIALGKGLLEVGKRKREINLERDRNPIAYLAEAKKLEDGS